MDKIHPAVRMSMDLMNGSTNGNISSCRDSSSPNDESSCNPAGTLRYSALPLELSGFVLVDSSGMKSKLSRRFLLLNKSILYVFKNELKPGDIADAPLLTLDMARITVDVGTREHEIVLLIDSGQSGKFVFCAETQEDLERWFYCLKRARNQVEEFYELGKVIGKGAFGSVFIARDRLTGELCVVKVMTKNTRVRRQLALIQREINILKQINCHYVVKAFDIFNSEHDVSIVMELMRGGELYFLLRGGSAFNEDIACHITNQLLLAVEYLHARNIVHRDIKPENILLETRSSPPTVKIADFGLSNLLESGLVQENLLNSVVGSLLYVAPELLAGNGYGFSVDIWATGVILYAMLSGTLPFDIENKQDYERFLLQGPSFAEANWKSVSNLAKWFIRGLLQVDPVKRLSAVGALQHPWIQANPHKALIVPSETVNSASPIVLSPLRIKFRAAVSAIQILIFMLRIRASGATAINTSPNEELMQWARKISNTLSSASGQSTQMK
uniref:Protein kinase domain-containing protein n=1 Tax=Timspurckia oligopyrenoides TaxID=708627 RepID=A0A7S0ZLE1_9RHOD|mmetsp:Transcript_9729/g.17550  ORF Transcript_9729/g.17550 Transcript_9729/m.17550 type:complete len:501 (+) Transcript_9729:833-2335(+)